MFIIMSLGALNYNEWVSIIEVLYIDPLPFLVNDSSKIVRIHV